MISAFHLQGTVFMKTEDRVDPDTLEVKILYIMQKYLLRRFISSVQGGMFSDENFWLKYSIFFNVNEKFNSKFKAYLAVVQS